VQVSNNVFKFANLSYKYEFVL